MRMFCHSCGRSVEFGARFCSNCGAAVAAGAPPPAYPLTGKLVRPRYGRMIAGVCAGFAEYYHWDISLVRVVTVLLAIFTSGIGVLAYLAAWIIIPEAPYTLPHTTGSPTV